MNVLRRLFTVVLLGVFWGLIPCHAASLFVPGDYPTLTDAVTAAQPGDTVLVSPGRYSGPGFYGIDFDGKDIVVSSIEGAAHTILDGAGYFPQGFNLHSGESEASIVQGFTITDFFGNDLDGAGICVQGATTPTIRSCVIVGNMAAGMIHGAGGGIACRYGGNPTVVGCTIASNAAGNSYAPNSGGIFLKGASSSIRLEQCVIWGNLGEELYIEGTGSATLFCCAFDASEIQAGPNIHFEGEQIHEDPGFCNPQPPGMFPGDPLDYQLWHESPCLPWNNVCDALIGPLWIGCPTSSAPPADVRLPSIGLTVGQGPITGSIEYSIVLQQAMPVRVSLFDPSGTLVAAPLACQLSAGQHRHCFSLEPGGAASGFYYLALDAAGQRIARKVLIVR